MNAPFFTKATGVALASAVGLGLIVTVAVAQISSANRFNLSISTQGSTRLEGTVTAISGSTLSVSSWLGVWRVNAGSAQFLPESFVSLSQIHTGDHVVVRGTIANGMTVDAKTISDMSIQTINRIEGTINNLSAPAGTFTINAENNTQVTITTNVDTKIVVHGSASSLADLSNGMRVVALGSLNTGTNTLIAQEIKAPLSPVATAHSILKAIMDFKGLFVR